MNSQKQIATGFMLYAQDHEELLPAAEEAWGAINLDKGVLICPTAGTKVKNGYGYNNALAGQALGDIPIPTSTLVTCDATGGNILLTPANLDMRHSKHAVAAMLDGHVEVLTQATCITYLCATNTTLMTDLPPASTTFTATTSSNMLPNTAPWARGPSLDDAEAWPPNGGRTWIKHASDEGNPAPCLRIRFSHDAGAPLSNEYLSRTLPTVPGTANWWAVSADIKLTYNGPVDYRSAATIFLNDTSGNRMVTIYRQNWNWSLANDSYVKLNGTNFITGYWNTTSTSNLGDPAGCAEIDQLFGSWRTIKIIGYNGKIIMIYGSYMATATPLAGSNGAAPGRFGFMLGRDAGNAGINTGVFNIDNIAYETK